MGACLNTLKQAGIVKEIPPKGLYKGWALATENQPMRRLICAAAIVAALGVAPALADPCQAPLPARGATFSGPVTYIVDGDGLCVGADQGGIEVRLGDFDAPEMNGPDGQKAKEALRKIAFGRTVVCTACEGARNPNKCVSYDRIVATCRLNADRLGDLMRALGIKEGGR